MAHYGTKVPIVHQQYNTIQYNTIVKVKDTSTQQGIATIEQSSIELRIVVETRGTNPNVEKYEPDYQYDRASSKCHS